LLVTACVVALIVRLTCAREAREFLALGFGGIADSPEEAWSIFANNIRLVIGIVIATAVQQTTGLPRIVRIVSDVVLTILALVHCVLVGGAAGAYGARLVRALLPHGPVELLAFSLALGLYVAGRRGRLEVRPAAIAAVAAATGLAAAAVLETYLSP
jgi:hypothetical protein